MKSSAASDRQQPTSYISFMNSSAASDALQDTATGRAAQQTMATRGGQSGRGSWLNTPVSCSAGGTGPLKRSLHMHERREPSEQKEMSRSKICKQNVKQG